MLWHPILEGIPPLLEVFALGCHWLRAGAPVSLIPFFEIFLSRKRLYINLLLQHNQAQLNYLHGGVLDENSN